MGGLISDLKDKSETFVQVDRWFPSTQLCHICGNRQNVSLDERTFVCSGCGATEDRDIHSAINILNEGLKTFSAMRESEHLKSPVEPEASTFSSNTDSKFLAMKQEAIAF